jgi:hypothetical protein
MKMVKAALIILIVCCWMVLGLAACDWNGAGGAVGSGALAGSLFYEATAAAGGRQLNIQLTAIAGEQRAGVAGRFIP